MFVDANGRCIVVEATLDGAFEIHDNPVGGMTNQPEIHCHLTNLQNYIELNNRIPQGRKLSNIDIPVALGTGLLGLAGDTTPQSHFIRATTFVSLMERPNDEEGVNTGFHVLNNFDIPKGVVINTEGKIQYTQYTSMYDLQNTTGYLKRYETMTITPIKMDFNNSKGIQYLKISNKKH